MPDANPEWKEIKDGLEVIKTTINDYQTANDSDKVATGEKAAKLDEVIKKLDSRFEAVEKKLARQHNFRSAESDNQKGLEDFNMCRLARKKQPLSENDAADYSEVYEKYLRKGGRPELMSVTELKTLEEGIDSSGGYWVLPQISSRMIEKQFETSPMDLVATIETTQSDRFAYFVDFDEFDAEYTSELKARDATGTARIGKLYIDVHTTFAKIPVSTELLEDSTVNVTNWLTRKINNKIVRIRNENYINGTGAGEEFGIFSPDVPSSGAGNFGEVERIITAGATLDLTDFLNMFQELKSNYHGNATILMSRQMLYSQVLTLKDSQGRFLIDIWDRPITSNVADGRIPMSLAGFPIVFMQDMPKNTTTANQDLLAFGDFREGYSIVRRRGVTVLRDPYSLDGGVFFKIDSRGGADVTNSEAYKILRRSA